MLRKLFLAAALLALGGCYAYPAGYAGEPVYGYPAPVVAVPAPGVYVGGGWGYGHGCCWGGGWHRGGWR